MTWVRRPDDPVGELAELPTAYRDRILATTPMSHRRELVVRWRRWSHEGQYEPEGDWRVWLIRAGRGFGKTLAGAEWVWARVRETPEVRIALVSGTIEDVRRVMVEGKSGLIATARDDEKVRWNDDKGELTLPHGGKAYAYSAEAPEKLRGPEHHYAWCDELAKWRLGDAAWDNLTMTMRLGERPRVLVTTTPRPTALMRRVMALREPDLAQTNGRTHDNPHLPASFVAAVTAEYAGTRLGRQELDGEMIDDVAGALWTRATIEGARVPLAPALVRVVVAVDPPASAGGDACGIVAVGLGADGIGYVVEDASVAGRSPEGWARAVAECVARWDADRVIAEKNQGGDMVGSVLKAADAGMATTLVHASRAKAVRAEPVATLYERGQVKHVGAFPALEDELCGLLAGGGYEGTSRSPDRADALVWAVTELMLGARGQASVRRL